LAHGFGGQEGVSVCSSSDEDLVLCHTIVEKQKGKVRKKHMCKREMDRKLICFITALSCGKQSSPLRHKLFP
jgi:hypothetical protein